MILDWRRPHPLSIAVMAATFVTSNALPLIVIGVAGGGFGSDLVPLLLGGVTAGAGVAQWWMTTYAITETSVELRKGVLSRQARSIPFDRVQQVTVGEPFIARLFQMATVEVAEASADGEISISYLAVGSARQLAAQLRELTTGAAPAAPAMELGEEDPPAASALPPPPPQEYVVHDGRNIDTARFQLLMVAPGIIALIAVGGVGALALVVSGELSVAVATVLVAVALAVVVVGLQVLGSVLTLGNFQLARRGPVLAATMGVLSRRNLEVRSHRIQTLSVVSGPLARQAGLHQVAFSAAVGKSTPQQRISHLAPAIEADGVDPLIGRAVGGDGGWQTRLEPVSPITTQRFLLRAAIGLVLVGGPACVAAFLVAPMLPVAIVVTWVAAALMYAPARFRRLGVTLTDDRFIGRSGVINHRLTQLDPVNVQSVGVVANFFQRRLGVADLYVATAGIGPGHMVRVPDLPAERAQAYARELGRRAADSTWELRE